MVGRSPKKRRLTIEDKYTHLVVARFYHWTIFVHEDQAYLGRCYVAAKRKDANDLPDATQEERDELIGEGGIVDIIAMALTELFHPDRFNWPILGNEWKHLHMHVIPRYERSRTFLDETFTDNAWGKNYAPYDKRPLAPEKLIKLRDLLRTKIATWCPHVVPPS